MNKYYVYIYLDPRKPGKYKYGDYCFLYEPFYVGKGKGKRLYKISGRTKYFLNKINKIKNYNLNSIVIKIKENLNEEESFLLESELINLIGRKDLVRGYLVNYTDGGEGRSGYVCSNETRKLMSKSRKGENNPMYGESHSEKTRKVISDKMKNKFKCKKNHPFYGKSHSEESKKKMSYKKKKLFENGKLSFKGENQPSSKLTEKDVIEIWKYLNEGILSQTKIAKNFGVKRETISAIKNKRNWKHIKIEEIFG